MNIRIKAAKAREDILKFLETQPNGVSVHDICQALNLKRIRTGKRMIDFKVLGQVDYVGNSPHGAWVLPKFRETALNRLKKETLAKKEAWIARNRIRSEEKRAAKRAAKKTRPTMGEKPFVQIIVPASPEQKKPKLIISSVFDLGRLYVPHEKREGAFAHPSQAPSDPPATTLED